MEIIKLLNNAIDYIEKKLDEEIDINEVSKVAYSSRYHFQRLFYALTGFTVAEYIRNRRLTLAAQELYVTDKKVIDIALKYCYESPEAFTKAFHRLHGISPTAVKKGDARIKFFQKLSFQISIKGESEMVYRIVEKTAFKVFGKDFVTSTADGICHKEIPEFCNDIWENGIHDKINEVAGNPTGTLLYGIHFDFKENGERRYMMGWDAPNDNIPNELKTLVIPKHTWAVFEDKGTMPDGQVISNVWKRIYSEWFPSSEFEQVEGPCIEKYLWTNEQKLDYICEVWIPVKKKTCDIL